MKVSSVAVTVLSLLRVVTSAVSAQQQEAEECVDPLALETCRAELTQIQKEKELWIEVQNLAAKITRENCDERLAEMAKECHFISDDQVDSLKETQAANRKEQEQREALAAKQRMQEQKEAIERGVKEKVIPDVHNNNGSSNNKANDNDNNDDNDDDYNDEQEYANRPSQYEQMSKEEYKVERKKQYADLKESNQLTDSQLRQRLRQTEALNRELQRRLITASQLEDEYEAMLLEAQEAVDSAQEMVDALLSSVSAEGSADVEGASDADTVDAKAEETVVPPVNMATA